MIDLNELKRLEAAATPGPWYLDTVTHMARDAAYMPIVPNEATIRFFVAIRNAFPAIIAELEAARRVIAATKAFMAEQSPETGKVYRATLDAYEEMKPCVQ